MSDTSKKASGTKPLVVLALTVTLALVLVGSAAFEYTHVIHSARVTMESRASELARYFKQTAQAAEYDPGVLTKLSQDLTGGLVVAAHVVDASGVVLAASDDGAMGTSMDTEAVGQALGQEGPLVIPRPPPHIDAYYALAPKRPAPAVIQAGVGGDLYGPLVLHLVLDGSRLHHTHQNALLHLVLTILAATILIVLAVAQYRMVGREARLQLALEKQHHLAALGRMGSVLAHEFRNPLGVVKGYAQLLEEDVPEGDPSKERLEVMVEEVVRLERLVRDILDFVRPPSVRLAPVDMGALVEKVAARWRMVEGHGATITVHLPPVPLTIAGDADRLDQVIDNLVGNACQAAGDGGAVSVGVTSTSDEAVVTVEDDGPGIEPSVADELFEPFVTTKTKGIGLGLAVVSRFVTEHGGRVAFDNRTAGGARFTVRLPLGGAHDDHDT